MTTFHAYEAEDGGVRLVGIRIQCKPGAWPERAEHQALLSTDTPIWSCGLWLLVLAYLDLKWGVAGSSHYPTTPRDSSPVATTGQTACRSFLAPYMGEREQQQQESPVPREDTPKASWGDTSQFIEIDQEKRDGE